MRVQHIVVGVMLSLGLGACGDGVERDTEQQRPPELTDAEKRKRANARFDAYCAEHDCSIYPEGYSTNGTDGLYMYSKIDQDSEKITGYFERSPFAECDDDGRLRRLIGTSPVDFTWPRCCASAPKSFDIPRIDEFAELRMWFEMNLRYSSHVSQSDLMMRLADWDGEEPQGELVEVGRHFVDLGAHPSSDKLRFYRSKEALFFGEPVMLRCGPSRCSFYYKSPSEPGVFIHIRSSPYGVTYIVRTSSLPLTV